MCQFGVVFDFFSLSLMVLPRCVAIRNLLTKQIERSGISTQKSTSKNTTEPNWIESQTLFAFSIWENGQREFFIQFDLYDKRKWELRSTKKWHKHTNTQTHTERERRERKRNKRNREKETNINKKTAITLDLISVLFPRLKIYFIE